MDGERDNMPLDPAVKFEVFTCIRHAKIDRLEALHAEHADSVLHTLVLDDDEGGSLLHLAVHSARDMVADVVAACLRMGVDPDVQDSNGDTALHLAVRALEVDAATTLVRVGADTKLLNGAGQMAAHICLAAARRNLAKAQPKGSELRMQMHMVRLLHGFERDGTNVPFCTICGDGEALVSLQCGHRACYDCIERWLHVLIVEGATFDGLTCPTCLVVLPPFEAARLVRDKGLLTQCDRKSLEVALAKMSDFHWCRRCHGGGLEPADSECNDLECECGSTQCKLCKSSGHPGLSCVEYLASDDYKCEVWKATETKICPVCKVAIEKVRVACAGVMVWFAAVALPVVLRHAVAF